MIRIAGTEYVMARVTPHDELGAPADPTALDVFMAFTTSERTVPDDDDAVEAEWQTDDSVTPNRYYARILVGPADGDGDVELAAGVWVPWTKPVSTPELPWLPGEPFRYLG